MTNEKQVRALIEELKTLENVTTKPVNEELKRIREICAVLVNEGYMDRGGRWIKKLNPTEHEKTI